MGCHGMDAKGMQAIGAPKLAGQSDWYLLSQLKKLKDGTRGSLMMKPIASGLDESAMRNIAAYLSSLSGK
jgi:cytochrome c553